MVKFLITAFIFVSVVAKAQEPITFLSVDSVTFQCYSTGDWDKLIQIGKQAISQNIDYKKLRHRIGYAYFIKSDYYAAQLHYEKALTFDEYDADTRAYLYYCGLNTGDEAYARFYAEKLPKDFLHKIREDKYKPVDAIDFEYSYKSNTSNTRSNPTYLRVGLKTQLGYRFSLYQSFSTYRQTFDAKLTKQPDYFVSLNWSAFPHTSIGVAYHYMNANIDGIQYPENLIYGSISTKLNRFSLGLDGSYLSNEIGGSTQFGLKFGATLPGRSSIYFNSWIGTMLEEGSDRVIFSQTTGVRLIKMLWAEGNFTLGNLRNYNDRNALYVYNSIDPTMFRTGLTLFYFLGNKATFFANYTYDKKQIARTNLNYEQYSFSGGIIWKL